MTEYLLASRYRLTDRIAAGGMGEVWRALDQLLNRQVAVKLLPTVRAGDDSSLARFRAEARFAASLSHPGIARVYDYGESAEFGGAYLVMELVQGDPLSAILARNGRLSADATLDIVGQAARALEAAHQAGIVHRDIKPGNILIAAGGTAKITDFGIATAVRAAQAAHLTQTGMVMGTAMYVSPEQATGATVTASSDIYSLGVVAFECLAGQPPFTAREPLAIAYAHKHDPVPPLPQDIPAPVVDLVLAMLAKIPAGRPPSAQAVADRADVLRDSLVMNTSQTRADFPAAPTRADEQIFSELTTSASDQYAPRRRRALAAGVTVGVCALAAGVSFYLSGNIFGKTTGDPSRTSVQEYTSSAPTTSSPASGPASPTNTAPNQVPVSVSKHKKKPVKPPVRTSPSHSTSPTAGSSPTSSPSASASASSSPASSPTATASPTNS